MYALGVVWNGRVKRGEKHWESFGMEGKSGARTVGRRLKQPISRHTEPGIEEFGPVSTEILRFGADER